MRHLSTLCHSCATPVTPRGPLRRAAEPLHLGEGQGRASATSGIAGGLYACQAPDAAGGKVDAQAAVGLKTHTHTHRDRNTHRRSVCSDEGPGRDRQTTLQRKKKGHIEIAKRAASSVSAMYYVSCIRNEADGFIVTLSPSHR